MLNIANLSAVKLTELGHKTLACDGFAEIARRIRSVRPDIVGNVRDTMAAFVGKDAEVARLTAMVKAKAAKRRFAKEAFRSSKKFYESKEWRELRYFVLKRDGGKCACCGATAHDGAVLHVDHIKPRSLAPEMELSSENLQVLCGECNLGKSNLDDTDWRSQKSHLREVMNG